MDEYNKLQANNEEQKQYLLLVIKEFRWRYPDVNRYILRQKQIQMQRVETREQTRQYTKTGA